MAKKGGAPENLDPVRTKEEAKKRGRNGGIKSGESRRNKRDAKNAMNLLLDMAAKGSIKQNLVELGFEDSDQTNMSALMARLYTMAMSGNLQAFDRIITISGNDPVENRRERESKASDKRKDKETEARVKAIEQKYTGDSVVPEGDDPFSEEETEDVIIVLPDDGRTVQKYIEEQKSGQPTKNEPEKVDSEVTAEVAEGEVENA